MRRFAQMGAGIVIVLLVAGCRSTIEVTEVPRTDLKTTGGNRGYLVGTPPPAASPRKTTRQMVETTIEIPTFYTAKPVGRPVDLDRIAPPEMDMAAGAAPIQVAPGSAESPGPYETYVVRRGDSLWSIAAKPEIYGKATRWRQLFDANRDLLGSPGDLRAGMTLKIPKGEQDMTTYGDEGITVKK